MKIIQKKPYEAPALTIVRTAPMQVLAASGDPEDPADPESAGGDIQTLLTGDANGDGSVDVTDAVAVINAYLTSDQSSINTGVADVNHDEVIDITDAVAIINLYLNSH